MRHTEKAFQDGNNSGEFDSLEAGVRALDEMIPGCEVSVSRTAEGWRAHVTHAPSGMGFRSLRPHQSPGLSVLEAALTLRVPYKVHLGRVLARDHVPELAP